MVWEVALEGKSDRIKAGQVLVVCCKSEPFRALLQEGEWHAIQPIR